MGFSDDFQKGIGRAARILQFDRAAVVETADDPAAMAVGVAIIAIGGLLGGSLRALLHARVFALVFAPALAVVFSFIGVGVWFAIGFLFKPQGWDFLRLYRALSHAAIVGWAGAANIMPFIGVMASGAITLFWLILAVVVVQEVGKLDVGKAIVIVLAPVVVCCGMAAVIGTVFGLGAWHYFQGLR